MMNFLDPSVVMCVINTRTTVLIWRNSLSVTGFLADFGPASMSMNCKREKNLLEEEMLHLSDVYQNYMDLNSNVKRMDSLMIFSRRKRTSRLEIIYTTTANVVRLLHRLDNEDLIPKDIG